LHRAVVQVTGDAVALGLDRRVGTAQQAAAVLVAVLQELEQRPDRLIGHPGRRDVAHEQQGPRRHGRHRRRPRFQVQHLTARPRDL